MTMITENREVLRENWEGKIPVCFNLIQDEVFTVEKPELYYTMVSRQIYFPLILDRVQRHFAKYIDPEKPAEIWLEYEGLPLKWHFPIGVLFDLQCLDIRLPWNLSVHFQNFPEGEILHCPSKEAVESHFMSMIKEADCLKHRSQVINAMQKKDHKQLWQGLQSEKLDQFWTVNKKLMEHSGEDSFRHIPFRIYQPDQPCIQLLFRPASDNGKPHTLLDLFTEALPEAVPIKGAKLKKILIQGIELPMDTSLLWLSIHFSHPDNFLHICVIPV